MHYYSSSTASSIYSQDGVLYPEPYDFSNDDDAYTDADAASIFSITDTRPLLATIIERKESSASNGSKSSKFSQASTLAASIYTEEHIKTLGYRPFEYWKGPLPVAAGNGGVDLEWINEKQRKASLKPPPRAALRRHSRALRDSLRIQAVVGSQARLRDSISASKEKTLAASSPGGSPPPLKRKPVPPPPPSPRVKDRYKHRYQLPRKEGEWPGWEPDQAVVRYFAMRFAAMEEELEKQGLENDGKLGKKKGDKRSDDERKMARSTQQPGTISEKLQQSPPQLPPRPPPSLLLRTKTSWTNLVREKQKQQDKLEKEDKRKERRLKSSNHNARKQRKQQRKFWPSLPEMHSKTVLDLKSGSDSGSIRLYGGHQQRILDPRAWKRRSWAFFTLMIMLLIGIILIVVSRSTGGGRESSLPSSSSSSFDSLANRLVVTTATITDDAVSSVRRSVHGGSLFRFGPILHSSRPQ